VAVMRRFGLGLSDAVQPADRGQVIGRWPGGVDLLSAAPAPEDDDDPAPSDDAEVRSPAGPAARQAKRAAAVPAARQRGGGRAVALGALGGSLTGAVVGAVTGWPVLGTLIGLDLGLLAGASTRWLTTTLAARPR
jgi:hypothetical protein